MIKRSFWYNPPMQLIKITLKSFVFILVIVLFAFAIKYYIDFREVQLLVEKYAAPNYDPDTEVASYDEAQEAAVSKNRRRKNKATTPTPEPTPVTAPTTSVPTQTPTTTTTTPISTSTPTPTSSPVTTSATSSTVPVTSPLPSANSKTINGIAAGYVLTTLTEAQLREYFSTMKTLGITWIRFDLNWSYIQKAGPTSYSWTEFDRIVTIANEYNIKTLGILAYAPTWAAKEGCSSLCAPSNPTYFANFASEAAKRYKGKVTAWEIWNEQNADNFWGPKANAADYVEVLKQGYAAIKAIDPNVTVLAGGMSPVDGSSSTIDPMTFTKTLYAGGAKNSFDAIAHHPYTYNLSPASAKPWNYWFQMYKIYDIMNQNGDAGKKIWITEYGAPTGGAGTGHELSSILPFMYGRDYMTQNAQSIIMTDFINEISKIKVWTGPVFWYSLIDINSSSADPEGSFGIIKSDKTKKQSYTVLQNSN